MDPNECDCSEKVKELAEAAKEKLITNKSKNKYLTSYTNFTTWQEINNCKRQKSKSSIAR